MWNKLKNNPINSIVILAMFIAIIVLSVFGFTKKDTANKTAYVELAVLFDGFDMKKELESKLKKDLAVKQNDLDSIMFILQGLSNKLNTTKENYNENALQFQQLQNYYVQQKKTFDEYSYTKTDQFDKQILEQLTQYVTDYGKLHDYDYVYGATSTGNIMYAKDTKNITKEVLLFINNKYQGKE